MSHRSIAPSPLSSVRLATSGVAELPPSTCAEPHDHCTSGSKLSGGALSLQSPIASMSSTTLQLGAGPSLSTWMSAPPIRSNFGSVAPASLLPVSPLRPCVPVSVPDSPVEVAVVVGAPLGSTAVGSTVVGLLVAAPAVAPPESPHPPRRSKKSETWRRSMGARWTKSRVRVKRP